MSSQLDRGGNSGGGESIHERGTARGCVGIAFYLTGREGNI
jgi:hypothetical protein